MTLNTTRQSPALIEPPTDADLELWSDYAEGERTSHRGTDFHLNPVFVADVGQERAEAFRDALISIGTAHRHRPMAEIRQALEQAFARLGIPVHPVELDKFADEIARSDDVTAHIAA